MVELIVGDKIKCPNTKKVIEIISVLGDSIWGIETIGYSTNNYAKRYDKKEVETFEKVFSANMSTLLNAKKLVDVNEKLIGDARNLTGKANRVFGEVTVLLSGNLTNVEGDLTGYSGNLYSLEGKIEDLYKQHPDKIRKFNIEKGEIKIGDKFRSPIGNDSIEVVARMGSNFWVRNLSQSKDINSATRIAMSTLKTLKKVDLDINDEVKLFREALLGDRDAQKLLVDKYNEPWNGLRIKLLSKKEDVITKPIEKSSFKIYKFEKSQEADRFVNLLQLNRISLMRDGADIVVADDDVNKADIIFDNWGVEQVKTSFIKPVEKEDLLKVKKEEVLNERFEVWERGEIKTDDLGERTLPDSFINSYGTEQEAREAIKRCQEENPEILALYIKDTTTEKEIISNLNKQSSTGTDNVKYEILPNGWTIVMDVTGGDENFYNIYATPPVGLEKYLKEDIIDGPFIEVKDIGIDEEELDWDTAEVRTDKAFKKFKEKILKIKPLSKELFQQLEGEDREIQEENLKKQLKEKEDEIKTIKKEIESLGYLISTVSVSGLNKQSKYSYSIQEEMFSLRDLEQIKKLVGVKDINIIHDADNGETRIESEISIPEVGTYLNERSIKFNYTDVDKKESLNKQSKEKKASSLHKLAVSIQEGEARVIKYLEIDEVEYSNNIQSILKDFSLPKEERVSKIKEAMKVYFENIEPTVKEANWDKIKIDDSEVNNLVDEYERIHKEQNLNKQSDEDFSDILDEFEAYCKRMNEDETNIDNLIEYLDKNYHYITEGLYDTVLEEWGKRFPEDKKGKLNKQSYETEEIEEVLHDIIEEEFEKGKEHQSEAIRIVKILLDIRNVPHLQEYIENYIGNEFDLRQYVEDYIDDNIEKVENLSKQYKVCYKKENIDIVETFNSLEKAVEKRFNLISEGLKEQDILLKNDKDIQIETLASLNKQSDYKNAEIWWLNLSKVLKEVLLEEESINSQEDWNKLSIPERAKLILKFYEENPGRVVRTPTKGIAEYENLNKQSSKETYTIKGIEDIVTEKERDVEMTFSYNISKDKVVEDFEIINGKWLDTNIDMSKEELQKFVEYHTEDWFYDFLVEQLLENELIEKMNK